MGKSLTYKILQEHLVDGTLRTGEEIGILIDHTLLQDATGTLSMLEFESLDIERVRVKLALQCVDHNILQTDNKNADDHRYLMTACARFGIHYSPPGNGICHQVHMERFGIPGRTLLGADSHTPTAGGISMLAIGAGGLDVALAMAGRPYYLPCPEVMGIRLTGKLPEWVSARDINLELLRRYDVKGFIGRVIEFYGPGVRELSATQRATISNLGTELGATSTIFPSDERTRAFMEAQGRAELWRELKADDNPEFDHYDEIDLSSLEPLIACPSSPGNVVPVREVAGIKVDQVIIGSCANSSFSDLMMVSRIMERKRSHPNTMFHVNPGSRQVLENLVFHGAVITLLRAGARIHQSGCLGCIGMGQAPGTGQISLRTFTRNFPGRSGTKDDRVYLCSPETASASAIKGVITDPRELSKEMAYPRIKDPEKFIIDESSIIFPSPELSNTEIIRGPNIKPLPVMNELPEALNLFVALKLGDNISTDTIMPAGNQILPLRSNIDAISEYVFHSIRPDFKKLCRGKEPIAIIGGDNYGQGSSREHAALAPRYLGVRVKIAKGFARIHKANLCNFGIIPLTFKNSSDYERIKEGMKISIPDIRKRIISGEKEIPVIVEGESILTELDVSPRQRRYLISGGALNLAREDLKRES